MAKDISSK